MCNAVRISVLNVLMMLLSSEDSLFGLSLTLRRIVDIRIVAFVVALSVSRHAWSAPQRAAFAVRWEKSD